MMSKVAIVTGASRGIGAATALRLATNGYDVCVNFIANDKAANKVVSMIESLGSKAIAVKADVSKEAEVCRLFDTLTIGLSKEVAAEGIRVNCVCPGFIYTDIHNDGGEPDRVNRLKHQLPMQRGGQAEEVAAAIAWLASDESSYTTGSFIEVQVVDRSQNQSSSLS